MKTTTATDKIWLDFQQMAEQNIPGAQIAKSWTMKTDEITLRRQSHHKLQELTLRVTKSPIIRSHGNEQNVQRAKKLVAVYPC